MFDSTGLPPYPPARNAWEYPPPPVNRRWKWIAIIGSAVALVAAVAAVSTAVAIGTDDYPGVIDDGDLIALISDECEVMTATVESMPVRGGAGSQARIIAVQNDAIELMVGAIRRDRELVASDRPTELWLRDWERLVEARNGYRNELRVGSGRDLVVPEDPSGDWISYRMDDVFIDAAVCTVPDVLLFPYPDFDPDGEPDSDI